MTDIITLKARAETAYRAVRKLAEENDEFQNHVTARLEGVKDTLTMAVYAELTAKKRYATAVQDAEDILRICYHDFDISPETMLDPDIHAAVSSMLRGADPWNEIEADDQKKEGSVA